MIDAQGECETRRLACEDVWPLVHDAADRLDELRREAKRQQHDLFAPAFDAAQLAEWEGIYRAVCVEVRARQSAFWRGCTHATAQA